MITYISLDISEVLHLNMEQQYFQAMETLMFSLPKSTIVEISSGQKESEALEMIEVFEFLLISLEIAILRDTSMEVSHMVQKQ